MGFFNVGFLEKTHWVQSDRTQSGPPCLELRAWKKYLAIIKIKVKSYCSFKLKTTIPTEFVTYLARDIAIVYLRQHVALNGEITVGTI